MYLKSLILSAFFVLVLSDYAVVFSCSTQNCPKGCPECDTIEGGPFKGIAICADSSGCTFTTPFSFEIKCATCQNGKDCSYSITQSGKISFQGCVNIYSDLVWSIYGPLLDQFYKLTVSSSGSYDWCGNACESASGGLSMVWIVVIVGVSVAVAVFIGILIYKRMQKRQKGPTLITQKSDPSLPTKYSNLKGNQNPYFVPKQNQNPYLANQNENRDFVSKKTYKPLAS